MVLKSVRARLQVGLNLSCLCQDQLRVEVNPFKSCSSVRVVYLCLKSPDVDKQCNKLFHSV